MIHPAAALKGGLYVNAATLGVAFALGVAATLGVAAFLHCYAPVVAMLTMASGVRETLNASKVLGMFISTENYAGEQVRCYMP